MLIGTVFMLPVILGYIAFVYWLFRGKVRIEAVTAGEAVWLNVWSAQRLRRWLETGGSVTEARGGKPRLAAHRG